MTIKVGTLCLLVNGHFCAGRTCTVTHAIALYIVRNARGAGRLMVGYGVSIPGVARLHPRSVGLFAQQSQLLPIAPPGFTDDTPTAIDTPEEAFR